MDRWLTKPIPVFWFAGFLVVVIIMATASYFRDISHTKRMDEFMSKGDRFTAEDGQRLESRVTELEEKLDGQ